MSKWRLCCVGFVLMVVVLPLHAQKFEWLKKMNEVKLLVDPYEQVIEKFGTPERRPGDSKRLETYKYKEGDLLVVFTRPTCEHSDGDIDRRGWNVSEGIVEQLDFCPNVQTWLSFKDIGVDLSNFEITESYGTKHYYNKEKGIAISVRDDGWIINLWYHPNEEQQKMRCKS